MITFYDNVTLSQSIHIYILTKITEGLLRRLLSLQPPYPVKVHFCWECKPMVQNPQRTATGRSIVHPYRMERMVG